MQTLNWSILIGSFSFIAAETKNHSGALAVELVMGKGARFVMKIPVKLGEKNHHYNP